MPLALTEGGAENAHGSNNGGPRDLWSVPSARAYLRAVRGAAACLRAGGQPARAADCLRHLVAVNSSDEQQCREELLGVLFEGGDWEGLRVLVAVGDNVAPLFLFLVAHTESLNSRNEGF